MLKHFTAIQRVDKSFIFIMRISVNMYIIITCVCVCVKFFLENKVYAMRTIWNESSNERCLFSKYYREQVAEKKNRMITTITGIVRLRAQLWPPQFDQIRWFGKFNDYAGRKILLKLRRKIKGLCNCNSFHNIH